MSHGDGLKDKTINGVDVVTFQNLRFKDSEQQWKKYLPTSMVNQYDKWYHFSLGHCGM